VSGIAAVSARRLSHKEVRATCADVSSHLWLHRVEGYHHADLALVQNMGHRHATTVDRNIPVVAEVE
jgi:hypothetical protein